MIWTETATVWTFGSRRYLSKYACVRAYCVKCMIEHGYADGYENDDEFRYFLARGAGEESDVLERYYQWCLTAIRSNGAKVRPFCSHNLPPGCCAACISEAAKQASF